MSRWLPGYHPRLSRWADEVKLRNRLVTTRMNKQRKYLIWAEWQAEVHGRLVKRELRRGFPIPPEVYVLAREAGHWARIACQQTDLRGDN